MDLTAAIVAGVVATAIMTTLMYLSPLMGMPKMDMLGMMGTMIVPQTNTTAYVIGGIVHFLMGIVFAIVYTWIWLNWFGAPTWLWGLIFGAIHGVIAIVVMPLMMRVHPRPPQMQTGALTAVGMIMGHMVFGVGVALIYSALA